MVIKSMFKNNKYMKVVSLILSLIILLNILPTSSLKASHLEPLYYGKSGDLDWEIDNNGTLIISGSGDYELLYDDENEVKCPEWYFYREYIDSVIVDVADITNCNSMFRYLWLETINLKKLDTSKVTDMSNMFGACFIRGDLDISSFDTSSVKNMRAMFSNSFVGGGINIDNIYTGNVKDMSYMFQGFHCNTQTTLDLSCFDTRNVINMSNMFGSCYFIESLDLSNFDTRNVTDMSYIFYDCEYIKSLELNNLNTENVTDMSFMFYNCKSLKSLDVSMFVTANVTDMFCMFKNCSVLEELDVSGFNTSNVTSHEKMFQGCHNITFLDLSNFSVSYANCMFDGCWALEKIYSPKKCTYEAILPDYSGEWVDLNGNSYIALPLSVNNSIELIKINDNDFDDELSFKTKFSTRDTYSFGNEGKRISYNILNEYFGPVEAFMYWNKGIGSNGLCYGMAVSAMASSFYKLPSAFSYGSNFLCDVERNTYSSFTNMSAQKFIEYTHVSQYTYYIQSMRKNAEKDLNALYDAIINYLNSNAEPVYLGIRGRASNSGHGLWVLGIGENTSEKTEILVYDCNSPNDLKSLWLYKCNGLFVSWEYEIFKGEFWGTGRVNADLIFYNPAKFCVDNFKYTLGNSRTLISVDNNSVELSLNNNKIKLDPEVENENLTYVEVDEISVDSHLKQESHFFWADLPDSFSINTTQKETNFDIALEDVGISLSVPEDTHAKISTIINSNNELSLIMPDEKEFSFSFYDINDETKNIDIITFSGHSNEKKLTVSQTEEGILLETVPCEDIKIVKEVINEDGFQNKIDTIIISSTANNVLIQEENEKIIGREDQDGDGNFETVITIPSKPENVTAKLSGGHNAVKFSWTPSDRANQYEIYYKKIDSSSFLYLGSVKSAGCMIRNLSDDTEYIFKVIPCYFDGKQKHFDESQYAVATCATTKNIKAPSMININLYKYNAVELSWNSSKGANGYILYYKEASQSEYRRIIKTTKNKCRIKNLHDGKEYVFKIVPYYKKNTKEIASFYSNMASIYTLKRMDTPIVKKKTNRRVKVTWSNIQGESGYQISKSTKKSKTNIIVTIKTTTRNSKTFSVLKNKKYYYKIRAYKIVNGKKIYGPWSKIKTFKLK